MTAPKEYNTPADDLQGILSGALLTARGGGFFEGALPPNFALAVDHKLEGSTAF